MLHDLTDEHLPATTTEDILVLKLAQSYWLGQRAIRIGSSDMGDLKQLALMMRYQGLHDRSFNSALKQLTQLQKTRFAEEREEPRLAAAAKSVSLETKTIRLELLRYQRDDLVARKSEFMSAAELSQGILELREALRGVDDDDEPELLDEPLAAPHNPSHPN